MSGFSLTGAILAALVVVHEVGHYLAGLAIGIPRSSMRIALGFPISEVTLRDQNGEVDPGGYGRDLALFHRLTRTTGRAFVFVSGGMAAQTLVVAGTSAVLHRMPATGPLAAPIVWNSLLLLVGYLLLDILWSRRTRLPQGDTTVLWGISRRGTLALLAALGAIHLGLLNRLG